MPLEKYMNRLVHENSILNVVIIRDDAVGTSRLVHENAINNVVIIRDSAVGASSQRPEYVLQQIKKAHQRPSFTNMSERNSVAPKLPNRKSSCEEILLKSKIKESDRNRQSSLNALFLTSDERNKKGGPRRSNLNGEDKVLPLPNRQSRRKLFDEIFADVDILFEESQKRSRFNHVA
jgi:hypothetical protein